MNYYRLSRERKYNDLIAITESPYDYVDDNTKDWYTSMFTYNEFHYENFQKTGSIAGITDNFTDKVWWDLDSKDLELAAKDTKELYNRLLEKSCPAGAIQLYFSGQKGFTIVANITHKLDANQVRYWCLELAKGLSTCDPSVYDNQRILRLPNTRHASSGLYKISIAPSDLDNIDYIKKMAEKPGRLLSYDTWDTLEFNVQFPINIQRIKEEKVYISLPPEAIDWSKKPKWLTNCRWALQNGLFKEGQRSHALLCLGSTYKNMGFELDHVYRLLKGVTTIQAQRNNCERFSDEELYNNVVMQVYGPHWRNGQYSCKEEHSWLHNYCHSLESNACVFDKKAETPKRVSELNNAFKQYIVNIEKNTIKTGLESIDKNVPITTGSYIGIVGSAGCGKTSLCLNILRNTSKAGVPSVFASLDMHSNRMYEKMLYNVTGLSRNELYNTYKSYPEKEKEIVAKVDKEFGNVYFFKKSCPTVADLKEYILECQEQRGEKIKLVMVDYFERVMSEYSDETQASKKIAGDLQDLVDELDICLMVLVQPNKFSLAGGVDKPIYDYTAIKGSSFLYQGFRIIFSLNRPFGTIEHKANDKYLQICLIKNDMGEVNEFFFHWNGRKGEISELNPLQQEQLIEALEEKKKQNEAKDDHSW